MDKQKKADLALVVITFFWGIANLISDYMMGFWAPMQLNAIRFIVAFIVSYAVLRRHMKSISRATLLASVLVGFLLSVIYLFAMYGLKNSSSITTFSFVIAMPVIINPIINLIFRRIVPEKKFLISLALSMAGLYLMTMKGGDFHMGKGEVLALLSATCYSIDICFTDVMVARDDVDPRQFGMLQIGFGAVFMSLISLFLDRGHTLVWSPAIVAGLLTLAVGSTALAFIVQPIAQQYTTSNHVGVIFTLEPVFSTLAAIIVIHEIVSGREYFGAVLMIAAVILMNVDFKRKDKTNEEDPQHL
ncbi:MAG: DMT family transporter [Firmicutes bacterium]|nr:DMT family transporter [Bacillota bacterium]